MTARSRSICLVLSVCVLAGSASAGLRLPAYRPSPQEVSQNYRNADSLRDVWGGKSFKLSLQPRWIDGGFWYRNDLKDGKKEFIRVTHETGSRTPAFDHAKLATALGEKLGKKIEAEKLPFNEIEFVQSGKAIRFDAEGKGWRYNLESQTIEETAPTQPRRQQPPGQWNQDLWQAPRRDTPSPDGKWVARLDGKNVLVRAKEGAEFALTDNGTETAYFTRIHWSPDSRYLVASRVTVGDRGLVHLIESSPQGGGRAKLHTRVYDQPGDKVDTFDLWILDPAARTSTAVEADVIDYGNSPQVRWSSDGKRFTYGKMDRGYGRWRLIEVDPEKGTSRTILDDDPATFVDSTSQFLHQCRKTDEIVWRSERDGWGHLYLADADGAIIHQITKGEWVVRGVDRVDEEARQIVFRASGMDKGEDPYFIHVYRVDFDGKNLQCLTPEPGNHQVSYSPDGKYLVDTYSTVSQPPVHNLRRVSDGKLMATLETADISELLKTGWKAPEVFVAKGRDGKTDIWGIVYRPRNYDPKKRYPVIEDIYAGPHDSFVPKSFAPYRYDQSVAELGFIVVQIDGMGTKNRGKAFHDVAYKNLADSGFPDRVRWIKALAAKYPYVDAGNVGIFGTSAGGQESTAAVLFHPEFYKVAVSSCGCHDNRMDKIWWNEQWMGLMGPHYAEQSNITNAAKLRGNLMLLVGELDRNVPPESTYRLADALIKANKEFELVLIPGADHTSGGTYGERKRRDFFVRHLLGVETPGWNLVTPPAPPPRRRG